MFTRQFAIVHYSRIHSDACISWQCIMHIAHKRNYELTEKNSLIVCNACTLFYKTKRYCCIGAYFKHYIKFCQHAWITQINNIALHTADKKHRKCCDFQQIAILNLLFATAIVKNVAVASSNPRYELILGYAVITNCNGLRRKKRKKITWKLSN